MPRFRLINTMTLNISLSVVLSWFHIGFDAYKASSTLIWISSKLGICADGRRPNPHSVAMPKSGNTAFAASIRARVPTAPSV
jgi:hypothetical protein